MNEKTAELFSKQYQNNNAYNRCDNEPEHGFPRRTQWKKNGWNRIARQLLQTEMPHVQYVANARRPGIGIPSWKNCIQDIGNWRQMDFMWLRHMGIADQRFPRDLQHATCGVNYTQASPIFCLSGSHNWEHLRQRHQPLICARGRWQLLPQSILFRRVRLGRRNMLRTLNACMGGTKVRMFTVSLTLFFHS